MATEVKVSDYLYNYLKDSTWNLVSNQAFEFINQLRF